MSNYIKSPLNYIGGKHKILDHIIPRFPKSINNFVDLFAGGFNVGINVNAQTIFANDQLKYLVELYSFLKDKDINDFLAEVEEIISRFNLSKVNAEGYNALRKKYNLERSPLELFVLVSYSFNHQIRFNSKHEFNTPFGKNRSSFNKSTEQNLISFCSALHDKNIIFSSVDFRCFDFTRLEAGDVVYCDPPYLITNGSYNDGNRGFKDWTSAEDLALLETLDNLNERGILFALSNVFAHKGQENKALIEWSRKYFVSQINKSYSNCSYHFKERSTKTLEVLITNFDARNENEN